MINLSTGSRSWVGGELIRTYWAALLCSVSVAVCAQAQTVPPSVQPGSIERELNNQAPTAPTNKVSIPAPNGLEAPANAASVSIHLSGVDIVGASAIAPAVLAPLYSNLIGRDATVADLYAAANAITAKYVAAGYAISFAVVPKQTIESGHAEIDVVEGYVAETRFEGAPPPAMLKGFAAHITSSRPLKTATLERFLLLANDVPGFTVKSVFEKMEGAARGATRLVIHVERKAFSASATVDNRGSRALGPWRADVSAHLNDLLGQGESIGLRGFLSSDAKELRYGSTEVSWPLGNNGTRLKLEASYSDSHPGVPLLSAAGFGANGITARFGLEHPLIRSRAETLQLDAFAGGQWLKSNLMSAPNSRDHIYTLSVGGTYWGYDDHGVTSAGAHLVQGLGVFDATTDHSALRSRSAGSGVYTALNLNAMRLQELGSGFEGLLSGSGQLASRGLLGSQQCGYGGMQFGRGFDDSELVGDNCFMTSAELRYGFAGVPALNSLQVYGFGDAGYAERRGTLLPTERRSDTAYSAGLGLRWRFNDNLSGWVEFAQPISRDVALEGNRHGRVFFALTGGF